MEDDLTIIDIAVCIMRSVDKALKTTARITLVEMPRVTKVELINARLLMAAKGMFVSVLQFNRLFKKKRYKGACVLYIPKSNLSSMFQAIGITEESPEAQLRDACGEFCNMLLACLKKEVMNIGHSDFDISTPRSYVDSVDEAIDISDYCQNYGLSFIHDGKWLLTVDVAMEASD